MNADKTRIAYPSSSAFIGGQFLLSSVLARESGEGGAIGASGFAAFGDGLLKFFGYGAPVFVAVSVGEGEWENRELRQVRDLCIFDAAFRFYEWSVLLSCGHVDTRIVRVSARMHKVEPYATLRLPQRFGGFVDEWRQVIGNRGEKILNAGEMAALSLHMCLRHS